MTKDRPWKICDCAHCETGSANKASVRNAHLKTLLAMTPDRLLEIARAAYSTGDVSGASARFDVDQGVVALALLHWKRVALGEAVPRQCIKVGLRGPAKASDEKASRRAIRIADKAARQVQAKEKKRAKSNALIAKGPVA